MARFHKAIWSHPGADYADGPDSVGPMVDRLAQAGFDLIVPVVKGGGGYVSYHSRIAKVHPQFEAWDPLRVLSGKATATGMKVHPWMCVFHEGEDSALFGKDETLRMMDRDGGATPWACPAAAAVREYERSLFEEVMEEYDVAGVHMDYIRYNSEDVCFCERCRSGFKAETGTDPLEIGKVSEFNVYGERGKNRKHPDWAAWVEWRAGWVTRFVEELAGSVRGRGKELSAAVFMEVPECVVYEGQNWSDWGERGLVDVLMPMTYTNSTLMVKQRTRNHLAQVKGGCSVWAGLGKGSSRSILSTGMLVEQVQAAREEGAEGIAVFSHTALTDEDLVALADMG